MLQDPTELVLLSLTILFCPDMLDLTDRGKVEQVQLKFALLLQKYLNYRQVLTVYIKSLHFNFPTF